MEIDQSLDLKRDNAFDAIVLYGTAIIFSLIIILVALQTIVRNFGIPLQVQWTEPLSRILFVIGTYFGAAIASRNNEHIKLEFILDGVKFRYPRVGVVVDVIVRLLIVAFLAIAIIGLLTASLNNWGTVLPGTLSLTLGMLYFGISIGFITMIIYEIIRMIEVIQNPITESDNRGVVTSE